MDEDLTPPIEPEPQQPSAPPKSDPRATMAKMLRAGVPRETVSAWYEKHYGGGPAAPPAAPASAASRAREAQNAAERTESEKTPFIDTALTHVLNTAQGLPGMKPFEAGAGVVGSRLAHLFDPSQPKLSYAQSLKLLEDAQEKIPAPLRAIEQIAGGVALTPGLGGLKGLSAAKQAAATGAAYGGADALLDADPNTGILDRLKNTATGAALGGLLGGGLAKGAQKLAPRAAALADTWKGWRAGTPEALVVGAKQTADAAVSDAFVKALAEGEGKTRTQAVQRMLDTPRGKKVISDISDQLAERGITREDPRFLDEVFKQVSAKPPPGTALQQGEGRARTSWKADFLKALTTPGEKPPLHLDVAVAGETSPVYSHGHEATTGPVLPGTAGRARGEQAQVGLDPSGGVGRSAPRDVQGPMGPAFQIKANQERMMRPGVEIGAPAQFYEPVGGAEVLYGKRPTPRTLAGQGPGVTRVGGDITRPPAMRIETAPAEKLPAMMPQYGEAVGARAEQGRTQRARELALGAVREGEKASSTMKAMLTKSPEAITEWAKGATPSERKSFLDMLRREQAKQAKGQLNIFSRGAGLPFGAAAAGTMLAHGNPALAVGVPLMRAGWAASNPALYEAVRPTGPVSEKSLLRILRAMNALEQGATNTERSTKRE